MDSIEDDLDILKMYKYQNEELDSKEYQEYIKYLNIFFSKDNKKDEKFNKEFLDGNYILIDTKNSKKIITITPSKFINIQKMHIELKEYSNEILYKITNLIETKNNITEENRNEFEYLKNKYILFRKNINDIDVINENYYNEIENLYKDKIEKSYELAKYYQMRKDNYKKIEINEVIKKDLIKKFNNNNKKIPDNSTINKIAKEKKIPSSDIEFLFKWIESSYFYMSIKRELNDIDNNIKDKEIDFNKNTKYMIIKKPIIEK
jgi:hypothetical protein